MAYAKHNKVATAVDDPLAEVNKAEWNDNQPVTLEADENFVTDAEKTVIGNTSGSNSGDSAGAGTAQWNANKIQGKDVPAPAAGDDGKSLAYNHGTGAFVYAAGAASPGVVPVGGIIMWSGTIATIPATWAFCDGTANSPGPDLRDKFIVGASVDDAGAAKTNIAGALSQTGGATGHSHSGHAALSHTGFSISDHTDLTHGVSIANHPDLTHAAIASHPALSLEGMSHAAISLPGYTHPVLTIEGMTHANITIDGATHAVLTIEGQTHAVQSIASRNDLVVDALTHADISVPSRSEVVAAIAGKASFASGTNRSGMTSVPTNSGTMAATTYTLVSHPTHSATLPAWSISPASHPTFTASAPASHPTFTEAVASHPTFTASAPASHAAATTSIVSHPTMTASGLTHGAAGAHVGTDYGVHSITAPAGHGAAGTVVHSFAESSAHAVSGHDTVSQLPSYYALAFIQRMA